MNRRATRLFYAARPIDAGTLAAAGAGVRDRTASSSATGSRFSVSGSPPLSSCPAAWRTFPVSGRRLPISGRSVSSRTGDRPGIVNGAGGCRGAEPVPVALGALRFDRFADGELVVPEVTVIVPADQEASVVVVGSPDRVHELANGLPEIVAAAQAANRPRRLMSSGSRQLDLTRTSWTGSPPPWPKSPADVSTRSSLPTK